MRIEKRRYMCDRSGEMYERLYKQYEWAGDIITWTGLWVGRPHLDVLQEQFRTPLIKDDPTPLEHPRPFTVGELVD